MVSREAKECAENGAKTLTGYFGDDSWKNDIDLDKLDMSSLTDCILGQLFGSWAEGLDKLGIVNDDNYGYSNNYNKNLSYGDMQAAWKELLMIGSVHTTSGKQTLLIDISDRNYGNILLTSTDRQEIAGAKKALDAGNIDYKEYVEV